MGRVLFLLDFEMPSMRQASLGSNISPLVEAPRFGHAAARINVAALATVIRYAAFGSPREGSVSKVPLVPGRVASEGPLYKRKDVHILCGERGEWI